MILMGIVKARQSVYSMCVCVCVCVCARACMCVACYAVM